MSEVKRYDVLQDHEDYCDCGNSAGSIEAESADGEYVRASAYDAALLELAALRKMVADAEAILAASVVERTPAAFAWVVVSPDGKEFSELQSSEDAAKDLAHDMDGDLHPDHTGERHEIKAVYTTPARTRRTSSHHCTADDGERATEGWAG